MSAVTAVSDKNNLEIGIGSLKKSKIHKKPNL